MPPEITEVLIALAHVAVGGGLGSMARFWVSGVVARRHGETFPWGTLAVNVTGSAAIGVAAAVFLAAEGGISGQGTAWAGLVVGVLGSYTTVSSFALQTLALARSGETRRALANVALSLLLCLGAAAGALAVTAALIGGGSP